MGITNRANQAAQPQWPLRHGLTIAWCSWLVLQCWVRNPAACCLRILWFQPPRAPACTESCLRITVKCELSLGRWRSSDAHQLISTDQLQMKGKGHKSRASTVVLPIGNHSSLSAVSLYSAQEGKIISTVFRIHINNYKQSLTCGCSPMRISSGFFSLRQLTGIFVGPVIYTTAIFIS